MKYEHIARYIGTTPWAMLDAKMEELLEVFVHRARGERFSPEEIAARIGGDRDKSPASSKNGAVAVIPLRGVIAHRMSAMDDSSGGASAEGFTRAFQALVDDPSIGTIVIDVDSPGGTIPGVPEAANAVFQARETKQIIAVANATMASAAYWIASQAHELVAIPSALDRSIGSIGVFTVHQDLSAHLEKEGIKITLIKAGKNKAENNPFEPLSDDAKADIQASVDAAYAQFVKAVARGRGVSVSDVKSGYGEGRAFNAKDALAAGMIDRIATLDEVIGKLVGRKSAAGMRAEVYGLPIVAMTPEQEAEAAASGLRDITFGSIPQADGDDGRDEERRLRSL